MIVIKNLRVDVLTEPVFTDANIVIRSGERLGMTLGDGGEVGVFLETLAGLTEEDEGTITYEGERVAYISSEILETGSDALAQILHTRPTFLLVNCSGELSPEKKNTLKNVIRGFQGGLILAADDAEFMQLAKVTRIIEIQPTTKVVTTFTGKYEDYLIEREKTQARIREAYEKQQREKARLEGWLDKKRTEANSRPFENGAVIRAKAKYLKTEILDKEIPKPPEFE